MNNIAKYQITMFAVAGISAFIGFVVAWTQAPPVGSEYWFYLRVVVSVIAAMLVSSVITAIVNAVFVMKIFANQEL